MACAVFVRDVGQRSARGQPQRTGVARSGGAGCHRLRGRPSGDTQRRRDLCPWLVAAAPGSPHRARHQFAVDTGRARCSEPCDRRRPRELNRQQAAVAHWISRRYQVAPEPVSRLVQEAWAVGQKAQLDPTLILAIMAVESSFNPFAQSPVGAQGLMQVMTQGPRRQVRGVRRQPRGVRPGDQPARRRAGAQGVHRTRRQPRRRACASTSALPTWPTTAAMPARC